MAADDKKFPSLGLSIKREGPLGWIQWKGTKVCMDVFCSCGKHSHIDAGFLYHVECPFCGQVYECDGHITLRPLDFKPEGTQEADA
jgi:hypothetical protein